MKLDFALLSKPRRGQMGTKGTGRFPPSIELNTGGDNAAIAGDKVREVGPAADARPPASPPRPQVGVEPKAGSSAMSPSSPGVPTRSMDNDDIFDLKALDEEA